VTTAAQIATVSSCVDDVRNDTLLQLILEVFERSSSVLSSQLSSSLRRFHAAAPTVTQLDFDQLYSPSTVVWTEEIRQQKKNISVHSSTKKITTYYSVCKTDSPRSYTVTKTCLVF